MAQVSSRAMSASVAAAAQRIGQGKATPAQALVDHDPSLTSAVQYVFGNALVCQEIVVYTLMPHAHSNECLLQLLSPKCSNPL